MMEGFNVGIILPLFFSRAAHARRGVIAMCIRMAGAVHRTGGTLDTEGACCEGILD